MTIMTGLLEENRCSLLSECSHSSLVRSTYYLCILCGRWLDFSKICQISFGRLLQEYERSCTRVLLCGLQTSWCVAVFSQNVQKFPQNMGWNVPRNQGNDGNIKEPNDNPTIEISSLRPAPHWVQRRRVPPDGSWDLSVLTASSIDQKLRNMPLLSDSRFHN